MFKIYAWNPVCIKCGAQDMWDDNDWFGCNKCGATFSHHRPYR